jgi:hypothetical protein
MKHKKQPHTSPENYDHLSIRIEDSSGIRTGCAIINSALQFHKPSHTIHITGELLRLVSISLPFVEPAILWSLRDKENHVLYTKRSASLAPVGINETSTFHITFPFSILEKQPLADHISLQVCFLNTPIQNRKSRKLCT